MNDGILAVLADACAELERLRGVLLPHYEGKIGEPDLEVIERCRAVLDAQTAPPAVSLAGLPGQYTLFGGLEVQGDVVAKVRSLLENEPDTRNSYALLVGTYWLAFDGLAALLPPELHEPFKEWLNRPDTTSWKTIQNRTMELQHNHPELDSSATVRERRNRQATQGAVR